MNTKTLIPTVLALALSTCLLGACGGGGSNSMIRAESLPPSPPLPPPPTSPDEACPAGASSNCTVDIPSGISMDMTGGRQSDHALIKQGDGELSLTRESNHSGPPVVDYRFSGGTTIEGGGLRVTSSATLHSDVLVQAAAGLSVFGTVTGAVTNHGGLLLWDAVVGDVSNDGLLEPGSDIWTTDASARVQGNFSQAATGTLVAVIPMTAYGRMAGGFLTVTGRADIDGTLQLVQYGDVWGPYPLPTAPLTFQVLHADGGVFGQFAQWTSPGLFITGALRYQPNDVYFDATAISAAQAMATAQAGDAITLQSAARFDAALGSAVGTVPAPVTGLTSAQRQFLASAATIQRLQDYGQAVRTFDSLSGYGYDAAADALLQQAALPAQGLMARVGNLYPGSAAGTWSARPTTFATGSGAFSEQRSGFDQWLGDGLLVGGSIGWSDGNLKFDRFGGNARDRAPQWDFYLRRLGANDSYVFGNVGASHHDLDFGRQIDLGIRKQSAFATRALDVEHAYVETGREFRIFRGRLTPFAALSYAGMHGAGFTEQGGTGFELVAQPSFHQRTNAAVGLRFDRYWAAGSGRWTQLNVSTGYLHLLAARDDAYAAFTGAPDVTFSLAGMPHQRNTGWLQMSLGTGGENWAWLLGYDRHANVGAASVGMQFQF
jgi:uncharacterized protein with beta-barrel porin domain